MIIEYYGNIEAKREEQHHEMTDNQVVFISTIAAMQNVADIADVNVCKKNGLFGKGGSAEATFF